MLPETIKMDGVGFTLAHILSFEREEDFINFSKQQVYQHLPGDQALKNLKTVYKIAKQLAKKQKSNAVQTNVNAS